MLGATAMKRVLSALILSLTVLTASAGPHYHGPHKFGHSHGHNPGWWIAPAVVGGIVTYALTRPPVVVQPQVVYPNTLTPAPVGFHYESIVDANCNCYRWVLVSN